MNHRVAVWAYRPQIFYGIDNIGATYLGERNEMMDVDKILAKISIAHCKIYLAHRAIISIVRQTNSPSGGIALVFIDADSL